MFEKHKIKRYPKKTTALLIILFLITSIVFFNLFYMQREAYIEYRLKVEKKIDDLIKMNNMYQYYYGLVPDIDIEKANKKVEEKIKKFNLTKYDVSHEGFIFPVTDPNRTYTISKRAEYGYRVMDGRNQFHAGIDLSNSENGDVLSSNDGKILITDSDKYWGKYIIMYHQEDEKEKLTLYAHLHEIYVDEGDYVNQGFVIGWLGGSGEGSTAPHLHFAIYIRNSDGIYESSNFVRTSLHGRKQETKGVRLYKFMERKIFK